MEEKNYTYKELMSIFNDIREKTTDLNYSYEDTFTYVGLNTIRIAIKGIDKGTPEDLAMRLAEIYPKFVVVVGYRPRSILVFIKGPGPHSPYNSLRR